MLEGKSKPVYFFPDSSVFKDPLLPNPVIRYADLFNLRGNVVLEVPLKKGEITKAIIHGPTFFDVNGYDEFLAYPGEQLSVKESKDENYDIIREGHPQRSREILFLKEFHHLQQYPAFPLLLHPSIGTILCLENKQKERLAETKIISKILFDSLIAEYDVSKKFRKIIGNYPEKSYDAGLYLLYKYYRDTLDAHQLYIQKCKQLLPIFNSITSKTVLNSIYLLLNDFALEIAAKIRVRTESEFRFSFDSIATVFKGLPREYLLSRLMYHAYTHGIEVSPIYFKKYKHYSNDKSYRKVVLRVRAQQRAIDKRTNENKSNRLLAAGRNKIYNLETVLSTYKGKYVLLDFWATWCTPCRKELPYWNELIKQYANDQIVFLSISLDKEIQVWQKTIIAQGFETSLHYLLLNSDKSSFVKQFNIDIIPRYLLFDKEGKLINDDAPHPNNSELRYLLNKLISEN